MPSDSRWRQESFILQYLPNRKYLLTWVLYCEYPQCSRLTHEPLGVTVLSPSQWLRDYNSRAGTDVWLAGADILDREPDGNLWKGRVFA